MALIAGLDVGSLSTDAVLIDSGGQLRGSAIIPTGPRSGRAAEKALALALETAGLERSEIGLLAATGYGRKAVPGADRVVTEITAHARGAHHLFPETRTVIDIGGQDSKVIRLGESGQVLDFHMNDKCAAGTGRFLEVMAAKLEVELADLGELSLGAPDEVEISSVCTVFAESEVVSLVARDEDRGAIIRGLHRAVADRVSSMVRMIGLESPVLMTGGVALNRGVVELLERRLNEKILLPPEPQLIGALGAALIGAGG